MIGYTELKSSKNPPDETLMSLSEIFKERQTAVGLSDWEIVKGVSALRNGEPDRYGSAVLRALKNLDEGVKYPLLRDMFLVLGVDIEKAIAIAASTPPKL